MKKIEAILKGKQGDLAPIKEKKIRKSIEVALLNAEDDLQTQELEYENALVSLGSCSQDYTGVIERLVNIKLHIEDISAHISALKSVQVDLDIEVKAEL